jgi:hypothetical protein
MSVSNGFEMEKANIAVLAKRKPPFEALWSHETFGLEAAT